MRFASMSVIVRLSSLSKEPTRCRKVGLMVGLISCLFFISSAHATQAATCTFDNGGGDNLYSNALNWGGGIPCGGVPTALDAAVIPAGQIAILDADATVTNANIGGALQMGTYNFTTTAGLSSFGVPAGGYVTSTSGTLHVQGVASIDGTASTTNGNFLFDSTFIVNNGGVWDIAGGSATATGRLTIASGGTMIMGAGVLDVGNDFLNNGGTFTKGTGTVRPTSGGAQAFPCTVDFYNFTSLKTGGTLTFQASIGDNTMTISNGLTMSGLDTMTLGNACRLIVTPAWTIPSGSTFNIATHSLTSTGSLTNAGTFNAGSGTLDLNGNFVNTGTFAAQTGTVRVYGTADQALAGVLYNDLTSLKSSGTATFAASSTVLGALTMNGGTLSSGTSNMTVVGASSIISGATVTSTSGTLTFTGAATSTGSIGSVSGNMLFSSTLQNNGVLDIGSGNATTTDVVTSAGTIYGRTGTLHVVSDFVNTGTFTKGTGTVEATGGVAHVLPGVEYYNLTINKTDGIAETFASNATTTNVFTLTSGILSIGSQFFYVPGTFSNAGGLVTRSTGNVVHPIDTFAFTNVGGTTVTSYTTEDTMYIRAVDPDRNTSGTTTQSFSVTVTAAGGGGDSNVVTLTETGVATGIFTGSIKLVYAGVPTLGTGQMQISGSTTGNTSYTDAFDSTDTTSTSVTLTYTATTNNNGGSGGGGSSAAGSGLSPVVTTFMTTAIDQALLDNLKRIDVQIHGLVKLPNDGNAGTQEDSAVYYVGADGKRHAFPNVQTYATWYPNFDGVQVITGEQLASIPLGASVTYKPGVKMVKFMTDPKVYAVAKGGILRWVKSQAAAVELYGAQWNKNIDDINDAFFTNYTFGAEINGIGDFNPANVKASVQFPSDSLQM